MFVIVNRSQLFGFLTVMNSLEEVRNLQSSRLANAFKMLDEIDSMGNYSGEHVQTPLLKTIIVNNINHVIKKGLGFVYTGKIAIDLRKKGIILLNGQKGCGSQSRWTFSLVDMMEP